MAKANKKEAVVTTFEVNRAPHCEACGCPTWTGLTDGRCVVCRKQAEAGEGNNA